MVKGVMYNLYKQSAAARGRVQVDVLDDYARYFEQGGVALLKIDAEGHQYDILAGGEQVRGERTGGGEEVRADTGAGVVILRLIRRRRR